MGTPPWVCSCAVPPGPGATTTPPASAWGRLVASSRLAIAQRSLPCGDKLKVLLNRCAQICTAARNSQTSGSRWPSRGVTLNGPCARNGRRRVLRHTAPLAPDRLLMR
ncbi:hypothetical protein WR25_01922 [Diploscapter pachys]|uniref:Uncharacterized protein n=1 Tax=Diploscapter pachys TaxID=2018661 RepID=A0A2A2M526_9BILA|nr:hypothetical protein WR25_01922 [Diploscapter pachys]